MGYRSDVAFAFYPASEEHKGVVTLWLKENLPLDTWDVDEYWLIDEARGTYIFQAEGVKWYSEDRDVEVIESAFNKFRELFCGDDAVGGCEHVRIGEEIADLTTEYHGDSDYRLSVARSIHIG
jgi:hypothetical protein